MKRLTNSSLTDSWSLFGACTLLFLFFSFAGWMLRKDVVRLRDDPPLKASALEHYLKRSPADETEARNIAKLVRDYDLMESRYQLAVNGAMSLLFSASIAAAAVAALSLVAILSRRAGFSSVTGVELADPSSRPLINPYGKVKITVIKEGRTNGPAQTP